MSSLVVWAFEFDGNYLKYLSTLADTVFYFSCKDLKANLKCLLLEFRHLNSMEIIFMKYVEFSFESGALSKLIIQTLEE